MTGLEEELAKAFKNTGGSAKEMREINAKIAAEIAKKYIEKAIVCGVNIGINNWDEGNGFNSSEATKAKDEWLKENNITE